MTVCFISERKVLSLPIRLSNVESICVFDSCIHIDRICALYTHILYTICVWYRWYLWKKIANRIIILVRYKYDIHIWFILHAANSSMIHSIRIRPSPLGRTRCCSKKPSQYLIRSIRNSAYHNKCRCLSLSKDISWLSNQRCWTMRQSMSDASDSWCLLDCAYYSK